MRELWPGTIQLDEGECLKDYYSNERVVPMKVGDDVATFRIETEFDLGNGQKEFQIQIGGGRSIRVRGANLEAAIADCMASQ